ncbi:MAG: hypothetical protein IIW69_00285 [Bacteroidaceae bacterium]|nr:hypothetical protein [Bacteroidaceae bacterium]
MLSYCLFSSGSLSAARVSNARVSSARVSAAAVSAASSLFYTSAVAIAARTLVCLLTARCERYSNHSCEQKC